MPVFLVEPVRLYRPMAKSGWEEEKQHVSQPTFPLNPLDGVQETSSFLGNELSELAGTAFLNFSNSTKGGKLLPLIQHSASFPIITASDSSKFRKNFSRGFDQSTLRKNPLHTGGRWNDDSANRSRNVLAWLNDQEVQRLRTRNHYKKEIRPRTSQGTA